MKYPTAHPWFICPKPSSQAGMRLYCFPYAGGGVPVFSGWPEALPGVEVWIAQLPGRGSRFGEAALTAMLPLVQALARQLEASSDERPFAFFGHSLGARLSFELARSLRRQGKPLPAHLFVSACPAPQLPHGPPFHTLPKSAFLAELERFNGIPAEVLAEPELMDLLLPMLRADFTAYETAVYNSEPPLTCPISAFGGSEDPLVSREALSAWREQAAGPFQISFFSGDHFFLRTAEKELLRAIEMALAP
jgi:medium-chain acyl-[acyl-carrier-protein] hydrolase